MDHWRDFARPIIFLPSDYRRGFAHGGRGGEARLGRRASAFLAPPYSTSTWRRSGACLQAWSLELRVAPLWALRLRWLAANMARAILGAIDETAAPLGRLSASLRRCNFLQTGALTRA